MHSHSHHRATKNISRSIIINLVFAFIEVIGGLYTNSLAVISDAFHDLSDSAVLFSSLLLERQAGKEPNTSWTFGYRRLSLLSALINAGVLFVSSCFMIFYALDRFRSPEPVDANGMIFLSLLGIGFNAISLLNLKKGQTMNERLLSWHALEDVLGWIVILFGSIGIYLWELYILDPLLTMFFSLFLLWGVFRNFFEVANIFLQRVPSHIDVNHIEHGLCSISGVISVHDMHVWSLDGEHDVFTGHVVVSRHMIAHPDKALTTIKHELEHHHISHSTIELESEEYCSGIQCMEE